MCQSHENNKRNNTDRAKRRREKRTISQLDLTNKKKNPTRITVERKCKNAPASRSRSTIAPPPPPNPGTFLEQNHRFRNQFPAVLPEIRVSFATPMSSFDSPSFANKKIYGDLDLIATFFLMSSKPMKRSLKKIAWFLSGGGGACHIAEHQSFVAIFISAGPATYSANKLFQSFTTFPARRNMKMEACTRNLD